MATVLGKRKARSQKEEPSISQEEAQAIFRRHFEAQFAPLEPSDPVSKTGPASELEDLRSDDDDDSSEGSWDGISGSGSESDSESETTPPSMSAVEVVEVVSHTSTLPSLSNDPLSKRESKAYLSSRVPSSLETTSSATTTKRKATGDEDAPSLLKNDLALQRLLSESHLFSGQAHTGEGSTEHAGRNRHLATDLRLAALGSKTSIFKQAKMPMSHRKGIVAAATSRETKRRKEARENGIILERPAAGAGKGKPRMRKMERAVDAPAVGRLRNGMLKLSKKDIADIQGDGRRPKSGSGGKRRRR